MALKSYKQLKKRIPENKCVPNNPWRNAFVLQNNFYNKQAVSKDMRVKKWIPVHQILITGCY